MINTCAARPLGAALAMMLAAAFSAPASATDEGLTPEGLLTPEAILAMKSVSDIQISPAGDWVAYVVERSDLETDKRYGQIWMSATDGSAHVPLTAADANASSPRWHPDGSAIAFLGVRGKGEDLKSQVWLLDRRGGEAQPYTKVKQGVSRFSWAPDGSQMLLTIRDPEPEEGASDDEEKQAEKRDVKPIVIDRLQFKRDYVGYLDRRRSHLYLFDGMAEPKQITFGDYDDAEAVWSPDSSRIAFVSKREGDPDANVNSDIWIVAADPDLDTYPLIQVTTNKGADNSPTWSPDGKSIAYITSREPDKLWYDVTELAVTQAAAGGDERLVAPGYDRVVRRPAFAPDGEAVYVLPDDGGTRPLVRVELASGARRAVGETDVSTNAFALHVSGAVAVIASSYHAPFDVHWIEDGSVRPLTQLNEELLSNVRLAPVKRLKVAGWNGDLVESFVYYPPDHDAARAYPTLFLLHGGPVAQYDASFEAWAQYFAGQGYVTVLPNPHGSTGYGEAFTYALNRQWGVPDVADVEAIADHLVREGISDPEKLGVGGWSYGGILTNYMITKSTRFAGAVSGASLMLYRANYGHDHYQHVWEVEFGLPWENIEAWERISPFNDIGKVTTPTLVMGGQVDWNVPIQNSEQMFQALKRRGIATELVVYPGEHHGILRPSFRQDRLQRWLGWFDRYVKKQVD